jgi:hypothetical protein
VETAREKEVNRNPLQLLCGNCGRVMREGPVLVHRCFRCKRTVRVVGSAPLHPLHP